MKHRRAELIVETTASIAWFAMDGAWLLGSQPAGITFAVPTTVLSLTLPLFSLSARRPAEALVNGAMAAWACMNALWMVQNFRLVAWARTGAMLSLALGAALLVAALVVDRVRAEDQARARLRRLRLRFASEQGT